MDATQQKGSPKQLRGRSLGTKLSETEYAQCEKSAARRGQTLSEWCRQALLDAVAGPAPRPEAEVILSEIQGLPSDPSPICSSFQRNAFPQREGASQSTMSTLSMAPAF